LPLVGEAERRQLEEWSAPPGRRSGGDLIESFEEQAARTPDTAAVEAGDAILTYGDLDRRADVVARELLARGVGPGARGALPARRSPEQVIDLLAILKAGGCYVPIDPAHPVERRELIRQDAGVGIVLDGGDLSPTGAAGVPLSRIGPRRSVER